jgi:hypothetical protein
MIDWTALGTIVAIVALLVTVLLWALDRRRKAADAHSAQAVPALGIVAVVQNLSPLELQFIRHVLRLCADLALLRQSFPPNHPMNTAEGNDAKARLLAELTEPELMKAIGISSRTTFRAMVGNLERYGLVGCVTNDVFNVSSVYITELGSVALEAVSA